MSARAPTQAEILAVLKDRIEQDGSISPAVTEWARQVDLVRPPPMAVRYSQRHSWARLRGTEEEDSRGHLFRCSKCGLYQYRGSVWGSTASGSKSYLLATSSEIARADARRGLGWKRPGACKPPEAP